MSLPIEITVGGGLININGTDVPSPVSGATIWNCVPLAGISGFIDRSGYGIWGYENYRILVTGGIELLNGNTFTDQEIFFFVPVTTFFDTSGYTNYSNGFNYIQAVGKLFGRLAWNLSSGLTGPNVISRSGRRFDDGSFHSVVNVPNIKAVTPNLANYNSWFTEKQIAVIAKSLQSVFNETEFQDQLFINSPYDEITQPFENNGNAVGYKLEIVKDFDITHQINLVELYFTQAQTFNIYLFKSGSKTPLKIKEVTTVANHKTTVYFGDWFMNYKEANTYYVVYFQNDLTGGNQAIQENVSENCLHYFEAENFVAPTTGIDFKRDIFSYLQDSQIGINLQVSSFKDFTNHILNQPHLFDELIGLQMAYNVIEEILYSTESDKKERILKGQLTEIGLQLDLKGQAPISEGPKTKGLQQRIEAEIYRVKKSFYPVHKTKIVECL